VHKNVKITIGGNLHELDIVEVDSGRNPGIALPSAFLEQLIDDAIHLIVSQQWKHSGDAQPYTGWHHQILQWGIDTETIVFGIDDLKTPAIASVIHMFAIS
jgi:hypothetical protein